MALGPIPNMLSIHSTLIFYQCNRYVCGMHTCHVWLQMCVCNACVCLYLQCGVLRLTYFMSCFLLCTTVYFETRSFAELFWPFQLCQDALPLPLQNCSCFFVLYLCQSVSGLSCPLCGSPVFPRLLGSQQTLRAVIPLPYSVFFLNISLISCS